MRWYVCVYRIHASLLGAGERIENCMPEVIPIHPAMHKAWTDDLVVVAIWPKNVWGFCSVEYHDPILRLHELWPQTEITRACHEENTISHVVS